MRVLPAAGGQDQRHRQPQRHRGQRRRRRPVGGPAQHRQGRLPGQRDGHVEGADGEDRPGLRPQPPRLRHDGVGHALRQRDVLPRLGDPCLHLPPQGGQAAHHHRPADDPLPHVARRLRRPRQARVRPRPAGRPVRAQGGVDDRGDARHRRGSAVRPGRAGDPPHRHPARREAARDAADARGDRRRRPTRATTSGSRSTTAACSTRSTSARARRRSTRRPTTPRTRSRCSTSSRPWPSCARSPRSPPTRSCAREAAPDRRRGVPRLAPALPRPRHHRPRGRAGRAR